MSTYNIQQVSMPLCGVKMCTDIFWSKIRTVFWEQRSRETVSFEEQVMSKDKYTSMFSCKIEAIVLIILQIFWNAREEMFMNKQIYPSFCSNHKTLSHLDLKLKRWLIVEDVWLGNITRVISSDIPSFSWGIFGQVMRLDQSRAS